MKLANGEEMIELVRQLYPICRSITGDGLRATLRSVQAHVPLTLHEVPSGTPAFDWVVPPEWNLNRAVLRGPGGEVVADTAVQNLHIVNYSVPTKCRLSLSNLQSHLHSMPDKPDWIPYRTSYYAPTWGFCLPHRVRERLPEGEYDIDIDTTLQPGSLTYGELLIRGESEDEVLFSAHACHPSLANDNLAGIAVATALATRLSGRKLRHSYRFIFAPGTIGAITWLAMNQATASRIKHGLILSCLGDGGAMTYKRSRRGGADIDRAAEHVLTEKRQPHTVNDFSPYGYDERQYCSPGFNLPVGVLMRTPNGQYPEYHTSGDNPDLVKPEALEDSLATLENIVGVIERNATYINTHPHCEPQLGRRGLYAMTGGTTKPPGYEMAILWVLNYSDGRHDLIEISRKSKLPFDTVARAADALKSKELLRLAKPGELLVV